MKKILVILLFVFVANSIYSQRKVFKGIVVDSITKQPVPNVNITILPAGDFGSITDKGGYFSINDNKKSVLLRLSHISYYSKIFSLENPENKDTIFRLQLEPKIYILDEVNVVGRKYQRVYKKNNLSVLDYSVYKNRIYMIVKDYMQMKSNLISINTDLSDTLFLTSPATPKKLVIDLYGNLDLITSNDSVYQIINKDSIVYFLEPFSNIQLKKLSGSYKFIINDRYYFSEFEDLIMDRLDYGYISKDGERKIFYTVYDEKKINYYYRELCFLGNIMPHNRVPPGEKRRKLVMKHFNSPALTFDKMFLYNNIQDIIFPVRKKIYIINNISNILLKFNIGKNTLPDTIQIKFDNVGNEMITEGGRIWKNNILIDPVDTSNVYFYREVRNRTKLFALNLLTGTIKFVITLPHTFPEKIMISDSKVYYLFQKQGSLRNFGLYRTEIY